jgi:hypothetical protein
LLCAATINVRFRDILLHDPAQALSMGYLDHTFSLTAEEEALITSIQAQQLEDLAAQIHDWMSTKENGHGSNGHQQSVDLLDLPRIC